MLMYTEMYICIESRVHSRRYRPISRELEYDCECLDTGFSSLLLPVITIIVLLY